MSYSLTFSYCYQSPTFLESFHLFLSLPLLNSHLLLFPSSFPHPPTPLHPPTLSFHASPLISLLSLVLIFLCHYPSFSQLRPQLFPASTPAFPWRCPPALPGSAPLLGSRGQPADAALLLHRQGEVMLSLCVCLCTSGLLCLIRI